jgi:hypothetical protein
MKALWVIDPESDRGTVTLQGRSRDGGNPLWFQINRGVISDRAVDDPEHPARPHLGWGLAGCSLPRDLPSDWVLSTRR